MQCPECKSNHVHKNGKKKDKQNYRCVQCGRQFITKYNPHQGYDAEFKRECLKMYVNGMGFRAIERVKGVHHTTIITWVKEVGKLLPSAYDPESTPQVAELDELETFVGHKKTRFPKGYRSVTVGNPLGHMALDSSRSLPTRNSGMGDWKP